MNKLFFLKIIILCFVLAYINPLVEQLSQYATIEVKSQVDSLLRHI